MKFFGQEFEYSVIPLFNPSQSEFRKHNYDSEEYKKTETRKEHFELMLNEMGARGWELVTTLKDEENDERGVITKLLFKRSSWSRYYGTGKGVNTAAVYEIAKKRAGEGHGKLP